MLSIVDNVVVKNHYVKGLKKKGKDAFTHGLTPVVPCVCN